MKMRKCYIALLALLAFTACQQEPALPEGSHGGGNSFDPSKLRFNLIIEHPDGVTTKGVKKAWKTGDKVFLFISGISAGYLTATLTDTAWNTEYVSTDVASLGASGTLHAVYLPYGNDATPSYDDVNNKWTFDKGTDTYYFYASNVPYTVSGSVLSATVQMVKPIDYVQFFIPCSSASGTIRLASNGLQPAGFASIADDGTITDNSGTTGTPIYGYPDTLEGEEGYYVSGKPVVDLNNDYYFALEKADGSSYAHFFKHRAEPIANNKAYQLPAYASWPMVGDSYCVTFAGKRWKTVNEGATKPWEMGNLTYSFNPEEKEGLPTESDWTNLMDVNKATWKEMDIWGQKGYLVVSAVNPSNYIFLPWRTTETCNYWIGEFNSVFQIATDGTRTNNVVTPLPSQAYARMLEIKDYFRIKAKENGTKVYFYYTDGSVLYSTDYGETWNIPPTQANGGIDLNADEEACFQGTSTRTDCNLAGNKQLFTTNGKLCYIAGDITSLLNYPATLPANAFRSAFSYGSVTDANAENLEKNIPVATGTVDWVDIDSGDPLILPESTAAFCYTEMFLGCTSLHSAPDLPATVLADKCYFRMFYNCPGLSSIPAFPSVVTMSGTSNRRRYCFQMFQSCTGIQKLEGALFGGTMTLQANCFEDMFAHCTGLTSVDKDFLPATTLAASCYRGMFQDTRFSTAPDLKAETLVSECYRFMFNGCSSLTNVKCLATSNLGNGYTTNWLSNVPNNSTCTFVRAGTATWTRDAHGIPSKWTVDPPIE